MNALQIITLILAGAGLLLSFRKTMAATLSAYASVVCASLSGTDSWPEVSSDSLLFWGVATVIVTGLTYMNSRNKLLSGVPRAYIACGAIAGSLLGFIASHTSAAMITGAATGALLGAFAYYRTPAGAKTCTDRRIFTDYVCAAGLPAVVIVSMCGTAVSAVLY